jgi:hypothetical protein
MTDDILAGEYSEQVVRQLIGDPKFVKEALLEQIALIVAHTPLISLRRLYLESHLFQMRLLSQGRQYVQDHRPEDPTKEYGYIFWHDGSPRIRHYWGNIDELFWL